MIRPGFPASGSCSLTSEARTVAPGSPGDGGVGAWGWRGDMDSEFEVRSGPRCLPNRAATLGPVVSACSGLSAPVHPPGAHSSPQLQTTRGALGVLCPGHGAALEKADSFVAPG